MAALRQVLTAKPRTGGSLSKTGTGSEPGHLFAAILDRTRAARVATAGRLWMRSA